LVIIIAVSAFAITLPHSVVGDDPRRMPNVGEIRAYCSNPVPNEKRTCAHAHEAHTMLCS